MKHALHHLYTAKKEDVIGYVRNHGGSERDGLDVFHDALVQLHRRLTFHYDPEERMIRNVHAYLMAICKNLWSGKNRHPGPELTNKDQIEERSGGTTTADPGHLESDPFEEKETRDLLGKVINRLGQECAQSLRLRYFQRYSLEDVQSGMGWTISIKSVANRLQRCLAELGKIIEGNPELKDLYKI